MANEAIKPNLQKQSGDNVIGFPDLISQNKENVTFSPLSMENGFQSIKSQAGASAGKPPQTPQGNVTALFGELQAASELSLDELAKQSELLKDIEQNTKKCIFFRFFCCRGEAAFPKRSAADRSRKINARCTLLLGSLNSCRKNGSFFWVKPCKLGQ